MKKRVKSRSGETVVYGQTLLFTEQGSVNFTAANSATSLIRRRADILKPKVSYAITAQAVYVIIPQVQTWSKPQDFIRKHKPACRENAAGGLLFACFTVRLSNLLSKTVCGI